MILREIILISITSHQQKFKDFNVLLENKLFFDQLLKTNNKRSKNLSKCQEMMTIEKETYQIICTAKVIIDLLLLIYQNKETKVCFIGKSEDEGATVYFIAEMQQKTISNISLDSLNATE